MFTNHYGRSADQYYVLSVRSIQTAGSTGIAGKKDKRVDWRERQGKLRNAVGVSSSHTSSLFLPNVFFVELEFRT